LKAKKTGKEKLNKRSMSKKTRREKILSSFFLIPSLAGVLLFFILPFIVIIRYSLVANPISMEYVGTENYARVIGNQAFQTAVKNTAVFSAWAVPLAVLFSLLLAIMLEAKVPFRSQFRTFFLSPMMVPVASIVLIWQVLFNHQGAINEILLKLDMERIDFMKSEYAIMVVVILFLWKNLGYNMILFMAALASVPKDIVEVAKLDSANTFQIFFKIKLRYLSSTILFVTIMSLINSFKVFREIYLLSTDHPTGYFYMLQHFMNNKFKNMDYQVLSSAAILMSLVMIVIIGILFFVENRYGKDVEG